MLNIEESPADELASALGAAAQAPRPPPRRAQPAAALPNAAAITADLKARLNEIDTTEKEESIAKNCVKSLKATLAPLTVKAFGSLANGFGTSGADLDVICFKELGAGGAAAASATAVEELQLLQVLLAPHQEFEVLGTITSARVPILRLRYFRALDVDLSYNNTEPLRNTQLLKAYAHLDPRIPALGCLVKAWARDLGVCGAKYGHLTSYALVLMVLYFLQVEMELPCLPVSAFSGKLALPPEARAPWPCSVPLAVLLLHFFRFYASEFQWGSEVVAAHIGHRTTNIDQAHGCLRGRWVPRLHIQDPFLHDRNLNCHLWPDQEHILYERICEAVMTLMQGQTPVGMRPSSPCEGRREALHVMGDTAAPEADHGELPPASVPIV